MKTSTLTGHDDDSLFHSDAEHASRGEHNTLLQILAIAAFSILLVATTFAISNVSIKEVHTGHFLARVPH